MCANNGPDRKFVIPDPADVQIRKKVQRHEEGRKLSFPWARDWSSAEGVLCEVWSTSRTAKSPVFAEGKNGTKIQIKEIEKLLERHPDPRDPAGVSAFYEKQCRASCLK